MRVCNVDSACAHENIPSNSSTVAFFFPQQNLRTWPSADADDAYPREPFRRDHNVDILTIWQFYNNNDDNYYCGDNYTRGDTGFRVRVHALFTNTSASHYANNYAIVNYYFYNPFRCSRVYGQTHERADILSLRQKTKERDGRLVVSSGVYRKFRKC